MQFRLNLPLAYDVRECEFLTGHLYGHLRVLRRFDVNNGGGVPACGPVYGRLSFRFRTLQVRCVPTTSVLNTLFLSGVDEYLAGSAHVGNGTNSAPPLWGQR
jgi:hypothetical protein